MRPGTIELDGLAGAAGVGTARVGDRRCSGRSYACGCCSCGTWRRGTGWRWCRRGAEPLDRVKDCQSIGDGRCATGERCGTRVATAFLHARYFISATIRDRVIGDSKGILSTFNKLDFKLRCLRVIGSEHRVPVDIKVPLRRSAGNPGKYAASIRPGGAAA